MIDSKLRSIKYATMHVELIYKFKLCVIRSKTSFWALQLTEDAQLFNIVSQQDTQVSISIGEDSRRLASASKEDSLAMKTLAAVTMVFLPGTFVATLFSMPLFDWDKPAAASSGMVSNKFWIYWVVTIPLTSLTIILWAIWIRTQIRRKVRRAEVDKVAYQRDVLGAD